MKKCIILLFAVSALFACNSGGSKNETKDSTNKKETVTDNSNNPDYQKGLEVLSRTQICATCHKIDEKVTGPAWRDVAKKYAGQDTAVAHLSKKIISGGSGVWGEIPMPPNPGVSKEDAEALAKYVLSLNK